MLLFLQRVLYEGYNADDARRRIADFDIPSKEERLVDAWRKQGCTEGNRSMKYEHALRRDERSARVQV